MAEQRFTAAGAKLYILQYLYDESNNAVGFGIYYPTDTSPNWQYYYFGKNIQGDVIALYRSDYNSSNGTYSPTLVATYSYDPWGTPTGIYDANGNSISQTADHVAAYNPFRYRGYRYDGDTRLYYLQSRYYDPATGRFVNADGYASTGQGLVGHNMFAYCNNAPIVMKDFAGKVPSYCIAVSDGAAGASPSKYKPKPKADAYKRQQSFEICRSYGIGAPSGATSVQISATLGKTTRTQREYLEDSIPYILGVAGCTAVSALTTEFGLAISGASIIASLCGLGNNPSPEPDVYKSIHVVIEYDLQDPLTGKNVHYKEEALYLVTHKQNGDISGLYEDRYSRTDFYIGG